MAGRFLGYPPRRDWGIRRMPGDELIFNYTDLK